MTSLAFRCTLPEHVGLVVVESLAEQQQRLAASRDPLEVAGQRLERAGQRQRPIGAFAVAGILAVVHRDRAAHARGRLLLAVHFDDRRHHLHAGELVDRGEQPRLVGGEILRRRRQRAGREHAGVVVRADVVLDELPREGLDRPGASRADVMAVEHEDEHACRGERLVAGNILRDLHRALRRVGRPTGNETFSNATRVCGAPFSSTVISSRVRSVTGLPSRSRASTATSTTSTPLLNRGAGCCGAWPPATKPRGGAMPAIARIADSRTTFRTVCDY